MLQLTAPEWAALRSKSVIIKSGRGHHRKYSPYAFAEQGIAMLSSVSEVRERSPSIFESCARSFKCGSF
jgi:ORF6N domain